MCVRNFLIRAETRESDYNIAQIFEHPSSPLLSLSYFLFLLHFFTLKQIIKHQIMELFTIYIQKKTKIYVKEREKKKTCCAIHAELKIKEMNNKNNHICVYPYQGNHSLLALQFSN
jgi:hypothetical protein